MATGGAVPVEDVRPYAREILRLRVINRELGELLALEREVCERQLEELRAALPATSAAGATFELDEPPTRNEKPPR